MGGSLNGNWIGGPTYATSPRNGMEEVTAEFSVRFLRRMMGLGPGEELSYMALGAWNGGRIKSLTLHRGYQMERSPVLYTGGEANESWRCTDIESILDAPGDSYLNVCYTCTAAEVPDAYVLGWGAGVNGGWITGRSYKIKGLAVGQEYTAAMRMDEFRQSLGLSWDAKIDSLILSAYNNGKILAVWIDSRPVESGGENWTGGGGSSGGGSSGGGTSGGGTSDGGTDTIPSWSIEVKDYFDSSPDSVYKRIVELVDNNNNNIVKLDKGHFYKDNNTYTFAKGYGIDPVVSLLEKGGFLVVKYEGEKYPSLGFGIANEWGNVAPIYASDGMAVFSSASIRRKAGNQIKEISTIEIQFSELPGTPEVYGISDDSLAGSGVDNVISSDMPIAEMPSGSRYEVIPSAYNGKAGNSGQEMTVTLTFDREVTAWLWFTGAEGGYKKLQRKSGSGFVYTWEGNIPGDNYMAVVVEKVADGGKAKLMDIGIDTDTTFPVKITDSGEYIADVTFSFESSNSWIEGREVEIDFAGKKYNKSIRDGKVTLENIVIVNRSTPDIANGNFNITTRWNNRTCKCEGKMENVKNVECALYQSLNSHLFSCLRNATITIQICNIWGEPWAGNKVKIKDEGGSDSSSQEITTDSNGKISFITESGGSSHTGITLTIDDWRDDTVLVVTEIANSPVTVEEQSLFKVMEDDPAIEAVFTQTDNCCSYPFDKSENPMADTAEVTLHLTDDQGCAAEGVGIQVIAGLEGNAGAAADAVTDADGYAVLNVELPQTEEDNMSLYICVTDMAGYERLMLESVCVRVTPSEEDTEEDTEDSAVEGLHTFTAGGDAFNAPVSDYCEYEPGDTANVTVIFSDGTGNAPDGAQADIGIGEDTVSETVEGGKITLEAMSLSEDAGLTVDITDMAGYESIVLTSVELELRKEEEETDGIQAPNDIYIAEGEGVENPEEEKLPIEDEGGPGEPEPAGSEEIPEESPGESEPAGNEEILVEEPAPLKDEDDSPEEEGGDSCQIPDAMPEAEAVEMKEPVATRRENEYL